MEVNLPEGFKFPPVRFSAWVIPFFLILIATGGIGSIFYQVEPDEVGVVQRFGKYMRTTSPGLHGKLPFGIETVQNIKATRIFKEEFGFRTRLAGVRTIYNGRDTGETLQRSMAARGQASRTGTGNDPFLAESLMLTGDLNTAVVQWIVQYQIKDPVQYAFRIRNFQETLRNMSEAVMRLVVGDHTINEILTAGRVDIQDEAQKMLQEILDSYGTGIVIRNTILQDVNPPEEVKPSFNEVNEARQEKEKLINQAWAEYNRIIPKAKGEAEQQIREAEGYALARINRAKGDAERFLLSWQAYKLAPEVTRRRMYLETMEKTLPNFQQKWIVDDSVKGVMPLLNLTQEKGGQDK